MADGRTALAAGEELVSLRPNELDRLLEALARFGQRDADAVREQIRALRLVGGTIRLWPNEAELAALEAGLSGLDELPASRPVALDAAASGGGARPGVRR